MSFNNQPPSSLSPRSVWFQLVDSVSGESFKGTSADKIAVSSSADVADFRDAVKAKYSDSHLKVIAPSDLQVFKNKASFDKRNVEEGREGPVEEDSIVGDLGGTEEDALIVVVPSLIQSFQSMTLSYPPCAPQFFKNIANAVEEDGFIVFKDPIPSTELNKLYIRESYQKIIPQIKSGICKTIITGTPGIGKSLLLIYLLFKLVKKDERVLVMYHPLNIYYDGKGGVFELEDSQIPRSGDTFFWNSTLWCLFDAKGKSEADLNRLPYDWCTFVVSTSPRPALIYDFKKAYEEKVFYMPVWTLSELEVIAPLFPNALDWPQRFAILGGIPRHVFEKRENNPTKILEGACRDCSPDEFMEIVGLDSEITDKSKVVHSLVHMTSDPPFTTSSVRFASQTALNIIVRYKGNTAKLRMRELLASCEGNSLTAALCGYIFEPYTIELLENGGEFRCRQLVHKNTKVKPDETILTIPPSTKIVVDKVLSEQTVNQLYVPKSSNFAAIDAWIPGIGVFQMTVGKKHGINASVKKDLDMLGQEAKKLYWLLPPLYYESFTKKSPHDIEQYAVLIPLPPPEIVYFD